MKVCQTYLVVNIDNKCSKNLTQGPCVCFIVPSGIMICRGFINKKLEQKVNWFSHRQEKRLELKFFITFKLINNRTLSHNAETKDFAHLTSHPVQRWTGKNKAFCSPAGTRNGRLVIKVYSSIQ